MSEGLFDLAAEANIEEKAESNTEHQENQIEENNTGEKAVNFYWNETMPGEGDRPEWMKSKYKSVEDQAKAYLDLEKKFGGFVGKPEDYDFVTPFEEFGFEFDKESELAKELGGVLEHYNASQEFAESILKIYAKDKQASQVTKEDVMSSLGDHGERVIKTIGNFAVDNFNEAEVQTLQGMLNSSEQVQLMHKLLVNTFGDPQIASPQEITAYTPTRSKETVLAEMDKSIKDGTYDREASKKYKDELAAFVS